jgi:hypothetical protein
MCCWVPPPEKGDALFAVVLPWRSAGKRTLLAVTLPLARCCMLPVHNRGATLPCVRVGQLLQWRSPGTALGIASTQ